MIKLIKLTNQYQNQLIDMFDEWSEDIEQNHTNHSPGIIFKNDPHDDFNQYVNDLERKTADDQHVPSSTFFLYDDKKDRLLGAISIRHYLNDALARYGGHVGGGIRPSERRKGYSTLMIDLALQECKRLGLVNVCFMCNKDNVGSAKSIVNNGGILEREFIDEKGNLCQSYWINVDGPNK